jgi:sugar phosphate isomerase/epimerase
LFEHLKQIGLNRIQIALDPIRTEPKAWDRFGEQCQQNGIEIVSGMFGTVGEDYTTLESIKRTGGVVPDHTWEENWRNIQATATLARSLGIQLIGFHAGFLPHEAHDPAFAKLLGRIQQIARLFADQGIQVALETGQETAVTLKAFLQQLDCPNVGVNFDPANMILYDKGEPIEAMRTLGTWIKHCHIKDAKRTRQPGTWGEEVVVGTGEVNWPAFFRVLTELQFAGFCCIEREAGTQRVADIRTAREAIARFTA